MYTLGFRANRLGNQRDDGRRSIRNKMKASFIEGFMKFLDLDEDFATLLVEEGFLR